MFSRSASRSIPLYKASRCLYDDCVDKALFFGLGDGFVQLGHLSQFFRRVVFLGSLTLKNAQVEIGKTYPVEIE